MKTETTRFGRLLYLTSLAVISVMLAAPALAADLARVDFWPQGSLTQPGVFDDGPSVFYCDSGDFDYVDSEDSASACLPDPGAQTGHNNSNVSGGGRWHFNLWEDNRDDNPAKVRFYFYGDSSSAVECGRLGDALNDMGLSCGCNSACDLNVWISADRLFKKGQTRQTLGRFDIVEAGDGLDGPDLRIDYHQALYICEASGHANDKSWRVLQTWACDSSSGPALADVIIPPTGGSGQDDVLGVWNLPMQITVQKVPLPSDDGGTPPPSCTDNDNDGVCVEDGDWADNNPDVYPGHSDKGKRWGRDGVDNDCDGTPDA